jgi:hypothetical protein
MAEHFLRQNQLQKTPTPSVCTLTSGAPLSCIELKTPAASGSKQIGEKTTYAHNTSTQRTGTQTASKRIHENVSNEQKKEVCFTFSYCHLQCDFAKKTKTVGSDTKSTIALVDTDDTPAKVSAPTVDSDESDASSLFVKPSVPRTLFPTSSLTS